MKALLENFHFIRPGWLLLIPLALGLWWLWQKRTDPLRGWKTQMDPDLLNALTVGSESNRRRPATWLLAVWGLAIIGIAGPTWRLEPSPFADDATPLVILLKADISMDTPDPAPSRLERAQLKIADLSNARKGQPLGLIAYAGSAHLVLPPTRDTDIVVQMAAEISPSIMPLPGDRLDLALERATELLKDNDQGGSILVLSDSVETDPGSLKNLKTPFPIQFLAINTPDSSQDISLREAAKVLDAPVVALNVKDDDINALVRRAASTPVAQQGKEGGRWQEAGYWLLPFIIAIMAFSFQREEPEKQGS